jgi:indolepyruvate ferredoxin oxidoreductase alpha subunit
MTGHQDHPASGRNFNDATRRIPIRSVLEGLGVESIFEVDTYQQAKLAELVKTAMAAEGFSVVIARHPCMLKFAREARRKEGYALHRVDIDQKICERIHTCVERFGCPTFSRGQDGSVTINPDLCIGDGSCIQTCPKRAISKPKPVRKRP